MANAPITGPPGTPTSGSGYPQWGVKHTGAAGTGSYDVKEAATEAQKQQDIDQGYLEWFTSKAAAGDWVTGQKTPVLNGQVPGLSYGLGISGIAGWFLRGLKIILGGALIVMGIARLTGAEKTVQVVAGKAAEAAAL